MVEKTQKYLKDKPSRWIYSFFQLLDRILSLEFYSIRQGVIRYVLAEYPTVNPIKIAPGFVVKSFINERGIFESGERIADTSIYIG